MRYKIFENGAQVNVITADADFIEQYCAENGYTCEEAPLPGPAPTPQPESPVTWDEMAQAIREGVNEL